MAQPEVNALIVKGSPRPAEGHQSGWLVISIALLFLLSAVGLVGWAFLRRYRKSAVSTASNRDELLSGPGLLVKESSISRPKFDISDEPLARRVSASESPA
jgi:hypothetical protein